MDLRPWQPMKHTTKSRMKIGSLMDRPSPSNRLRRSTKAFNYVLSNTPKLRTYAEYIQMRKTLLDNIGSDYETDDNTNLGDSDFEEILKKVNFELTKTRYCESTDEEDNGILTVSKNDHNQSKSKVDRERESIRNSTNHTPSECGMKASILKNNRTSKARRKKSIAKLSSKSPDVKTKVIPDPADSPPCRGTVLPPTPEITDDGGGGTSELNSEYSSYRTTCIDEKASCKTTSLPGEDLRFSDRLDLSPLRSPKQSIDNNNISDLSKGTDRSIVKLNKQPLNRNLKDSGIEEESSREGFFKTCNVDFDSKTSDTNHKNDSIVPEHNSDNSNNNLTDEESLVFEEFKMSPSGSLHINEDQCKLSASEKITGEIDIKEKTPSLNSLSSGSAPQNKAPPIIMKTEIMNSKYTIINEKTIINFIADENDGLAYEERPLQSQDSDVSNCKTQKTPVKEAGKCTDHDTDSDAEEKNQFYKNDNPYNSKPLANSELSSECHYNETGIIAAAQTATTVKKSTDACETLASSGMNEDCEIDNTTDRYLEMGKKIAMSWKNSCTSDSSDSEDESSVRRAPIDAHATVTDASDSDSNDKTITNISEVEDRAGRDSQSIPSLNGTNRKPNSIHRTKSSEKSVSIVASEDEFFGSREEESDAEITTGEHIDDVQNSRKDDGQSKQLIKKAKTLPTILPRPTRLGDFVKENGLIPDVTSPSFALNDISEDDEIWILELPKTVDLEHQQGETITLGDSNTLRIGNDYYETLFKKTAAVSCILSSGEGKHLYKTVTIKPAGSILFRHKLSEKPTLPHIPSYTLNANAQFSKKSNVPFPNNLKVRHPLFGLDYEERLYKNIKAARELKERSKPRKKRGQVKPATYENEDNVATGLGDIGQNELTISSPVRSNEVVHRQDVPEKKPIECESCEISQIFEHKDFLTSTPLIGEASLRGVRKKNKSKGREKLPANRKRRRRSKWSILNFVARRKKNNPPLDATKKNNGNVKSLQESTRDKRKSNVHSIESSVSWREADAINAADSAFQMFAQKRNKRDKSKRLHGSSNSKRIKEAVGEGKEARSSTKGFTDDGEKHEDSSSVKRRKHFPL